MTISTQQSSVVDQGNGIVTSFSYSFLIPSTGNATVISTSAGGTATTLSATQYTMTGIGSTTGGTVTFVPGGSPLASGSYLSISRQLPLVQATSVSSQGSTFAAIEAALDYEMMCIQQLQGEFSRTVMAPPGDPAIGFLPPVGQRANQGMAFDANGNPIAGVLTTVPVSSFMIPVFQATSTTSAQAALGIPPSVFLNAKASPFNAKGDNSTDDTAAIKAWINAVFATGQTGYLPAGTYKMTSQIVFPCDNNNAGVSFIGDGIGQSILNGQAISSNPNFWAKNITASSSIYFKLLGIGLQGNIAGTVFEVGKPDFSDAINEPQIETSVQNFSTNANAIAVILNQALGGNFKLIANTGGPSVPLQMNAASFNVFNAGSFGSQGGGGIKFPASGGGGGFCYGNTFNSPDFENMATCLTIDAGADTFANTFNGGQWSWSANAVNANGGLSNYINNPNLAPVAVSVSTFFEASVGITVTGNGFLPGVTTPGFPGSGTPVTNTTGRTVEIFVWGGTISAISINGASGMTMSGGTFIVQNGGTIDFSYTGSPAWQWQAIL